MSNVKRRNSLRREQRERENCSIVRIKRSSRRNWTTRSRTSLSLSLSDVHRHIVRYEAQLTRHGVLSCPVKSLLEHNFGVHTKTTVIGGRRRYARSRLSTEDTKDLRDPAPSFRRVLLPGKHRRSSPRR